MQWFTTLAVSSSLLCLSVWDKCTVGKTKSRPRFAPVHSTEQQFWGNVLRNQLMQNKSGPELKKGRQHPKALHCPCGEHRLSGRYTLDHPSLSVWFCFRPCHIPGCTAGLDALRHPSAPWNWVLTQGSVSYGHLIWKYLTGEEYPWIRGKLPHPGGLASWYSSPNFFLEVEIMEHRCHKQQEVAIYVIRRNGVDWDILHQNAAFWILRANNEVSITLL